MTMCSYGYFGDLMTHSESLRWLGRYRYDISGVRTFLRHKSYSGTLNYVLAGPPGHHHLLTDSCGEGCPQCRYTGEQRHQNSLPVSTVTTIVSEDKPVERIPECTDPEHDCSSADPPCLHPQVQQINGK